MLLSVEEKEMGKIILSFVLLIVMQLAIVKSTPAGYSYPRPTQSFEPQIPDNFEPHGVEPPTENEIEEQKPPKPIETENDRSEFSSEEDFGEPSIAISNSNDQFNRIFSQQISQPPSAFPRIHHDYQTFYQYFS